MMVKEKIEFLDRARMLLNDTLTELSRIKGSMTDDRFARGLERSVIAQVRLARNECEREIDYLYDSRWDGVR